MKKIFVLLFLAQVSSYGFGQNTDNQSLTFNHVALSVRDVNRSAEFYKKALNLHEITNRTEVDGIRWFSLGEDKELHLISTISGNMTLNKAVHFALTISDFDSFVKNLDSMKIAYSDWPGNLNKVTTRADGIKQVYIQDPDGYWIEVNSVGQKNKTH